MHTDQSPSNPDAPRVSVCVLSYNHAPFVEQALRSIVRQQTAFPYEVIVADDCSTDDTLAIAKRVSLETAVPFRFLARTRNLGPRANFLDLLSAARGAYVAYLEADDYWTDSLKLASQVALLDARPEVSGCFGAARVVDSTGGDLGDYFEYHRASPPDTEVDLRTAIGQGSAAPACTLVFRRSAVTNLPAWYELDASHQALSVLLTEQGPLAFVNRVLGHYRIHPGGVWSAASRERRCAANLRYAVALATDTSLTQRFPREIGRRLALSAAALGKERLVAQRNLRGLLPLSRDIAPAINRASIRALALAIPDLTRFALRKLRG